MVKKTIFNPPKSKELSQLKSKIQLPKRQLRMKQLKIKLLKSLLWKPNKLNRILKMLPKSLPQKLCLMRGSLKMQTLYRSKCQRSSRKSKSKSLWSQPKNRHLQVKSLMTTTLVNSSLTLRLVLPTLSSQSKDT